MLHWKHGRKLIAAAVVLGLLSCTGVNVLAEGPEAEEAEANGTAEAVTLARTEEPEAVALLKMEEPEETIPAEPPAEVEAEAEAAEEIETEPVAEAAEEAETEAEPEAEAEPEIEAEEPAEPEAPAEAVEEAPEEAEPLEEPGEPEETEEPVEIEDEETPLAGLPGELSFALTELAALDAEQRAAVAAVWASNVFVYTNLEDMAALYAEAAGVSPEAGLVLTLGNAQSCADFLVNSYTGESLGEFLELYEQFRSYLQGSPAPEELIAQYYAMMAGWAALRDAEAEAFGESPILALLETYGGESAAADAAAFLAGLAGRADTAEID